MRVKHLAEAIILQSMEDLWSETERAEGIRFFAGEDFRTCASIAGMDTSDQIEILTMIGTSINEFQDAEKPGKRMAYDHAVRQPSARELANT